MFRTDSLSIIRSLALYTQQQVYVIQVMLTACQRDQDSILASSQHNLYDIYILLCVKCQTPDDGQRNCPKHVEFYSKNKFEKSVHLFGFIIRIYHGARFSECQIYILNRPTDRNSCLCIWPDFIQVVRFFVFLAETVWKKTTGKCTFQYEQFSLNTLYIQDASDKQ